MAEKQEDRFAAFQPFMVRRDEEGRPEPYEVPVLNLVPDGEEMPTIKILPTTIGSLKGITDPTKDAVLWPLEEKIDYVQRHVIEPPFAELTEEDILGRMTMWDLDMILIAAVQNGGPMRQKRPGKEKGRGGRPKKRSSSSKRSSTR